MAYRCTRCTREIYTAGEADRHESETTHYVDYYSSGGAEDVL